MTDTTEVGNQLRLDLLREALPYIQRFKGKTFVVKLSGKVTEAHEGLISLAEELALMHQVGIRLCVVHGGSKQLDFGHVGDIIQIDSRLLTVLLDQGYLPVISSLGADAEGKVFNINADTIAAEIAIQLQAEKLVLLSDVDGIHLRAGDAQTKLSRLTADEAEALIKQGTATGGMIPKLQNIVNLLRRGVKSAHIINGTSRNALLAEVFTDKGTGTMIAA